MTTLIKEKMNKNMNNMNIETLKTKAAILDELLELIENKYLGYLMSVIEKEKNIPIPKAKKMLSS